MTGRTLILGAILLAGVMAAPSQARPHSPKCFAMDGVLALSADAAFLLHPDHGRTLAIDPFRGPEWPKNLQRAMDKAQTEANTITAFLHGRYTVCRLGGTVPNAPWLHYVYIRSATRLKLAPDSPRG